MALRISDVLGVTREQLEKQGVFDGFVDIDAQFHLDPHLLESTKIPEFLQSHAKLEKHFTDIIHLLDSSQSRTDHLFRQAVSLLTFPEINSMKLGYATGGSGGKGIGPGLAQEITETAAEIIKAGIKDPVIFELVGLFEENVGADRISDMTIHIIRQDILKFSERVARTFDLDTQPYTYKGEIINMPFDKSTNRIITLIPFDILRNLPVALDWDSIDVVSSYNRALRARINKTVGNTWKQVQKRMSKKDIKNLLLENPELIYDLINLYRGKTDKQYDFKRDPAGEIVWADIADQFVMQFPLQLITKPGVIPPLFDIVTSICMHYKNLIENNSLNLCFYDDTHHLRHEKFAQLLFYGIADAYCAANNLDISREPNAGHGPVDFKISTGYRQRVNVEVKYSHNSGLVHGYTKQLPIYNAAENTSQSIYLIIQTTPYRNTIDRILKLHDENQKQGKRSPAIIIVDGRIKPSASKRK